MYIGTLGNTPIYIVVSTQCILDTQCIYGGGNVTQCIYPMYITMLHNVYRKCTTMYHSTMLPNLHLRCISKCNQMYIKCNPMYIPLFLLIPECIGWDIHCVAFYIHWVYTLQCIFGYTLGNKKRNPMYMSCNPMYIRMQPNVYTQCIFNIHWVTNIYTLGNSFT